MSTLRLRTLTDMATNTNQTSTFTDADRCRNLTVKGRRCKNGVSSRYNGGEGGSITHGLCKFHNKQRLAGKTLNLARNTFKPAHVSTGAKQKCCTNKNCPDPGPHPLSHFYKDSQNEANGRHEGMSCWCQWCNRTKGNKTEVATRKKANDLRAAKDARMMEKGRLRCHGKCGRYRLFKFFGADNRERMARRDYKCERCRDCAKAKYLKATRTPEFLARQAAREAQKQEALDLRKQGLKMCGRNLKKSYGCLRVLPIAEFAKNVAYRARNGDGLTEICRECEKRRKDTLYAERPWWYEYLRWKNQWKKYTVKDRITGELRRMTVDDWCQMWSEQDGLCAMCHNPGEWQERYKMSSLYVDHNHATGVVRALACSTCNSALGLSDEDSTTLRRMADYLEGFEEAA